jgi:pimeloyl-ACP methyl ester carboxylesterase
LILFDKRGTGLSDRVTGIPDRETRMDDVRAVMDAVGSTRAAIMGFSEGGPMTTLFAATYPERVAAAVLYGTYPSTLSRDDYPWGASREEIDQMIEERERHWGEPKYLEAYLTDGFGPSFAGDEQVCRWWRRLLLTSTSLGAVNQLSRMNAEVDVRHILSSIRVPTLVLHRRDDDSPVVDAGKYLAEHIAGAEFVELDGRDHIWFWNSGQIAAEIEPFLRGLRERGEWDVVERDRVLATVLFTDIVGSTAMAAELGDRAWRELLGRHHALIRRLLVRYRGTELDTAGDGFLRVVRRAGASDPLRSGDQRFRARARARGASRPAHRRVRGNGRQGRWYRRAHRRARRGGGAAGRGARLADAEGSRCRLRDRVR